MRIHATKKFLYSKEYNEIQRTEPLVVLGLTLVFFRILYHARLNKTRLESPEMKICLKPSTNQQKTAYLALCVQPPAKMPGWASHVFRKGRKQRLKFQGLHMTSQKAAFQRNTLNLLKD